MRDDFMKTIEQQIQEIYFAYYGRPADPLGLEYWVQQITEAAGNLESIVNAFGNSKEFTDRSDNLRFIVSVDGIYQYIDGDAALINRIYRQAFGRDADDGGREYYLELLTTGKASLPDIALRIVDGAAGEDAVVLDNRVMVGGEFTALVEQREANGMPLYRGCDDADLVSQYFAEVGLGDVQEALEGLPQLMESMADSYDGYSPHDDPSPSEGTTAPATLQDHVFQQHVFNGGPHVESLDGGIAESTISYSTDPWGVWIDLNVIDQATGEQSAHGPARSWALGDSIFNFQHVIGGNGPDVLTGNEFDNYLDGANGTDTLTGGGGSDMLTGGTGADVFKYHYPSEGGDLVAFVAAESPFTDTDAFHFEDVNFGSIGTVIYQDAADFANMADGNMLVSTRTTYADAEAAAVAIAGNGLITETDGFFVYTDNGDAVHLVYTDNLARNGNETEIAEITGVHIGDFSESNFVLF